MGLIKAATAAISSTLHDSWKEAIRCEDITNDILMVKKTTPTGVISNGSTIIVAPGQCAVIYDNGRIIDATAEDGTYIFDTSSTPSFFAGQFKDSFKEMWQRFTYNGATAKEQSVFFFNLKEIVNNKFGTATPIPFQDWSHPIPNRMTNTISPLSVKIRCYGTYTFKIENPAVFMQEIAGTANVFYKSTIIEQMRSEVIATFQNVLNELGNSQHRVPVLEMPSQTDEMKIMMEQRVYDEPIRRRGIKIVSFNVESVSLEEESEKKINSYELSSNTYMQQGQMTQAYSNAIQDAAKNSNGAANGFMGIGMMNMMSGGVMGGAAQNVWQEQPQGQNPNTQTYNPYNNVQQPVQNQEQLVAEKETPMQNAEEPAKKEQQKPQLSILGTNTEYEQKNNENVSQPIQENKEQSSQVNTYKMCKQCGTMNPNNAKFCLNCGNKLE